jgi:hypothetical protein
LRPRCAECTHQKRKKWCFSQFVLIRQNWIYLSHKALVIRKLKRFLQLPKKARLPQSGKKNSLSTHRFSRCDRGWVVTTKLLPSPGYCPRPPTRSTEVGTQTHACRLYSVSGIPFSAFWERAFSRPALRACVPSLCSRSSTLPVFHAGVLRSAFPQACALQV